MASTATDDAERLAALGPRLRELRRQRRTTLAELAAATDISTSTLSRLESGGRRATLELLLPIARAYRVSLDELIGPAPAADPRVSARPIRRRGRTLIPLTQQPGGVRAFKMLIPAHDPPIEQQSHTGYEWLYVLTGRLRLRLGELDLELGSGEAAEFDTHTPHWFGSTGKRPVELLVLFGPQGERVHLRARSGRAPAR